MENCRWSICFLQWHLFLFPAKFLANCAKRRFFFVVFRIFFCIFAASGTNSLLHHMLRHFHGLYSHRPWLSTIQRARIRSVIVKTHMAYIRKYFPGSEACHAYSDPKMFWYTLFKRSYASMQDIQVSSSTLPRSGKCFCLIEWRENWL